MRENKFMVWCEFEFEGEIIKSMESPTSWFLLTQTGKLWTYAPLEAPKPLDKAYKVAIPLFYSGHIDSTGKEIYESHIIAIEGHVNHIVGFEHGMFCWINVMPHTPIMEKLEKYKCKIIGTTFENPELRNKYGLKG